MELDSVIETVESAAWDAIGECDQVRGDELGLDLRAGHCLYVGDDFVAIHREHDRLLQYYGGFEYVDAEQRFEIHPFVFYSAESSRVAACIDHFNSIKETK